MLDITSTVQGSTLSPEEWQVLLERVEKLPVPALPDPQRAEPIQSPYSPCETGQKSMLASLAKRVIRVFPPVLFSAEAMVFGGHIFCCGAGIALTVLSSGAVPLLVLAGFGLAIATADIACFIYHQKHGLMMENDSIANAVFFIARRFYDEQQSQKLGVMVSLGSRALLTAVVVGQPFFVTSLGIVLPIFRPLSSAAYSTLAFMRYGAAGCPVTGTQVSVPFFRLLAHLLSSDECANQANTR